MEYSSEQKLFKILACSLLNQINWEEIEILKDFKINWAIVGHSERREYFSESNEIVGKKIARALKNNLNVIGCFGEKLE